jgi:hypothetical protein
MQYKLLRYEKQIDELGNIKGIFISVQLIGNEACHVQEYFLSEAEVASVSADEKNLTGILENVYAEAEIDFDAILARSKVSTIVETQNKRDSFIISPIKVALEKEILLSNVDVL